MRQIRETDLVTNLHVTNSRHGSVDTMVWSMHLCTPFAHFGPRRCRSFARGMGKNRSWRVPSAVESTAAEQATRRATSKGAKGANKQPSVAESGASEQRGQGDSQGLIKYWFYVYILLCAPKHKGKHSRNGFNYQLEHSRTRWLWPWSDIFGRCLNLRCMKKKQIVMSVFQVALCDKLDNTWFFVQIALWEQFEKWVKKPTYFRWVFFPDCIMRQIREMGLETNILAMSFSRLHYETT